MFKWIVLAACAGGAWWHFIGNNKLTEDEVREFYVEGRQAVNARQADILCDRMHEDFEARGFLTIGRKVVARSETKDTVCAGTRKLMSDLKNAEAGGTIFPMDNRFWLHSITLSPDRKSATVEISEETDIGGAWLQTRARSVETVVRQHGRIVLLRSEGNGSVQGVALAR